MMKRPSLPNTILTFFLLLSLFFVTPCFSADKTLVLLPFIMHVDPSKSYLRQGLHTMFTSRLSGEGIQIIPDESLLPLLREGEKQGLDSRERAEALAGELNADFAVFGSLTALGGSYSLDLAILDMEKAKETRVTEAVNEDQFIPRLADVAYEFRAAIQGIDIQALRAQRLRGLSAEEQATKGLFFTPDAEIARVSPTGRISLRTLIMAFDMGDLDGDGEKELVVLSRDKLLIYRKKGESFSLAGNLKTSFGESFLKVTVGDGDGNGRPEIYLTSRVGTMAQSSIWEWQGDFKKRLTVKGHLQVVKDPGIGRNLVLFQDTQVNVFTIGKIYTMQYDSAGKLVQREPLPGLDDAQFYTLALFDLDKDGSSEFLGLNKESRLWVWGRDGTVLYKGDSRIGGTNNYISIKQRDHLTFDPIIPFNSKVVVTDIDKDGSKEVLAIENIPMIGHLEQFRVYVKSKLVVFRIKGASLIPSLSSMKMQYCLMDMHVDGNRLYVAAQKPKISNIGDGSGRIMWFE